MVVNVLYGHQDDFSVEGHLSGIEGVIRLHLNPFIYMNDNVCVCMYVCINECGHRSWMYVNHSYWKYFTWDCGLFLDLMVSSTVMPTIKMLPSDATDIRLYHNTLHSNIHTYIHTISREMKTKSEDSYTCCSEETVGWPPKWYNKLHNIIVMVYAFKYALAYHWATVSCQL